MGKRAPRHGSSHKLSGYEIRSGKDGRVGIYTRNYNVRLATFNTDSAHLQQALTELFAEHHKAARPGKRGKVIRGGGVLSGDPGDKDYKPTGD